MAANVANAHRTGALENARWRRRTWRLRCPVRSRPGLLADFFNRALEGSGLLLAPRRQVGELFGGRDLQAHRLADLTQDHPGRLYGRSRGGQGGIGAKQRHSYHAKRNRDGALGKPF